MQTGPSTQRKILLGCVVLAALRFAFFAANDEYATDDAWISFRIARNLVEHSALTYDLARPPVEGMTNLLWTLLSATWIAAFPRIDPIFFAQIIGGISHLATVALAGTLAAAWAGELGGDPRLAAAAAGGLLAASGSMAFYAASGLETALDGLLFLWAVREIRKEILGTASRFAGLALALSACSRPEGVLAGMLLCGWLFWARPARSSALRVAVPFLLAVGALEAFRLGYYGDLVPNTFHAKSGILGEGFATLRDFLLDGLGILGPLALLPLLARSRPARGLLLVAAILSAGVVWSGGDWMPGYRRFAPEMIVFAVAAGVSVSLSFSLTLSQQGLRWATAAGVLASLVGSVVATLLQRDGHRFSGEALVRVAALAEAAPAVHDVALVDIGRFGYAYRGSIFDLGALTDARLARQPGGHLRKRWDAAYFAQRHPQLIVLLSHGDPWQPGAQLSGLRPVENDVLRSMKELGDYQIRLSIPQGFGNQLVVFARKGVSLPSRQ